MKDFILLIRTGLDDQVRRTATLKACLMKLTFCLGYNWYNPINLHHFIGKNKFIDVARVRKVICGLSLLGVVDFPALTTILLPDKFNEPLDK